MLLKIRLTQSGLGAWAKRCNKSICSLLWQYSTAYKIPPAATKLGLFLLFPYKPWRPRKMIKDRINSIIWNKFPQLARKLHSVGNNMVLDNEEFMAAYLQIIAEGQIFLSLRDMFNIYYYVSLAKVLNGDMAEVGVFQGKGAKLISLFKGNACLHLFDTFEGMPPLDKDKDTYKMGSFSETSLQKVQSYLKDYPNIKYYKGRFPDTASNSEVAPRKFSFVHLDADIFQSTLDGLRFFYPRLVPGGFLISHDYGSQSAPGVKAAFDIFCEETGMFPIPLWDTQCLLIKQTARIEFIN